MIKLMDKPEMEFESQKLNIKAAMFSKAADTKLISGSKNGFQHI